jgi:GTP-binding protein EngB required for normal cell division
LLTARLWLDVLDESVRACTLHGRDDLARWLRLRRAQLLGPSLRVAVVGESRQGKSQLINALVNAPVCPTGDTITTTVPTVVRYGREPAAVLVRGPSGSAQNPSPGRAVDHRPRTAQLVQIPDLRHLALSVDSDAETRIPVAVTDLASHVCGPIGGRRDTALRYSEVCVPRALLSSGLMLIDTPGTDSPGTPHPAGTAAALAEADTLIMVSDATRDLSETELRLLAQLGRLHPSTVVALTKIDMVPDWRHVAERSRQRLAAAGVRASLVPVSSTLRLHAAHTADQRMNAESGFPGLIALLKRDLTLKGDRLVRMSVALTVTAVVEQLAGPLRAELVTSIDEDSSGAIARVRRAQRELEELRRCVGRWQNILADETTDMTTDIEHDLRDRTRRIMRRVEETFDTADPITGWDAVESWLEENLLEAAEANLGWLAQRCRYATQRVAEPFLPFGYQAPTQWKIEMPRDLASRVSGPEKPHFEAYPLGQKLYTGLRGSYGGVLLVGVAGTLVGMSMFTPISIAIGVTFGRRSVKDEGKMVLRRRQAAAKAAAQRCVDDFFLNLSKECRDTVRSMQRTLREHFTGITDELQQSIVQSLQTAKEAAEVDAARRNRRRRDIEQELARLAAIHEQARALAAAFAPTSGLQRDLAR